MKLVPRCLSYFFFALQGFIPYVIASDQPNRDDVVLEIVI